MRHPSPNPALRAPAHPRRARSSVLATRGLPAWAAAALLATTTPARADDPRAVLLGNSYTDFNALDQRFAELSRSSVPAWGALTAERLTSGGLTLNDHLSRARSERSDNLWWTRFGAGSPPAALVTLQDQSQVPGFPESHPFWAADAAAVGELADIADRLGAQTFLLATWGRRDGDDGNPELYPDFLTMNDRIDAGYRRYAELNDRPDRPIYIAPAGRAFAAVYAAELAAGRDPLASDSAFAALYNGDGSHPAPIGSALVAGVIVTAATGWSPRWLSPPPDLSLGEVEPWVRVVEQVVVPDGDLRYPWAFAWEASPTDADPAGARRVISHPLRLETELLPPGETRVEALALGGQHPDGAAGAGRLWVPGGATLRASGLRLGDAEGAHGEVVIHGGVASLGEVTGGGGRGRVQLRSGSATLDALRLGEAGPSPRFDYAVELQGGALVLGEAPSLSQTGGSLEGVSGGAAVEVFASSGGSVVAPVTGPALTAGRWAATGSLVLTRAEPCSPELPSQVVVEAAVCDIDGLRVEAPEGCAAELDRRGDGGCSLVLRGAPGADSGGPEPEPGDGGGDGGAPTDSAAAPDLADSGLKIVPVAEGPGCGCSAPGAPRAAAAWLGLLGLSGALLRRRRGQGR